MHHWLNGENVLASATRQPAAAVQAHKVFLLAYLRLKIQPVSIRSVSTKLKVNSGRTNPSSTSQKANVSCTNGIDPLDGFQVNLATIRPLHKRTGYREVLLL